jgi:hypothetical protein
MNFRAWRSEWAGRRLNTTFGSKEQYEERLLRCSLVGKTCLSSGCRESRAFVFEI